MNTPDKSTIPRGSLLPGKILDDPVQEIDKNDPNVRQKLMENGRNIFQDFSRSEAVSYFFDANFT